MITVEQQQLLDCETVEELKTLLVLQAANAANVETISSLTGLTPAAATKALKSLARTWFVHVEWEAGIAIYLKNSASLEAPSKLVITSNTSITSKQVTSKQEKKKPTNLNRLEGQKEKKNLAKKTGETITPFAELLSPEQEADQSFVDCWIEWVKFRKSIKRKPVSEFAAKRTLNKLSKFSTAVAISALQQGMDNEWQGVFPERVVPKSSEVVKPTAVTNDDGQVWLPPASRE